MTQGLWIAKFNRADDRWNYARVEHAMLVLAKKCGISAAESRVVQVGGKDVLLVRRFDRFKTENGYARARMISGLTLLQADENERDRWSYISLAEEIRRLVANPSRDAPELFRRMCFNALISNIDDHPRNHALIAKEREWNLSPAYDLDALACHCAGTQGPGDDLRRQGPLRLREQYPFAAYALLARPGRCKDDRGEHEGASVCHLV